MNVKGLIIAAGLHQDKMFNCEVSIPALKIHLDEKESEKLSLIIAQTNPKVSYTHIMFMINGNPVEVNLYEKEKGIFYANAREVAELNLNNMTILKENTLVKKYLKKPAEPKKLKKF